MVERFSPVDYTSAPGREIEARAEVGSGQSLMRRGQVSPDPLNNRDMVQGEGSNSQSLHSKRARFKESRVREAREVEIRIPSTSTRGEPRPENIIDMGPSSSSEDEPSTIMNEGK